MQVKKYIAEDMQQAVKMIKEELGNKAIIISTKKVRKGTGAFGLFGKYVLEVTAAKDDRPVKKVDPQQYNGLLERQKLTPYQQELQQGTTPSAEPQPGNEARIPQRAAHPGIPKRNYNAIQEDINELKDLVLDLRKGYRREVNDEASISHLRYELSELKNMINTLVAQSGELRAGDLHENLIALYQQLSFNGVEEKFAKRLVEEVQRKIPQVEIDNFSYVKIYLARMFMQVLQVDANPTENRSRRAPKILSFLGPTGVGKTTTLAKIAGSEKLKNPNLKLGLITLDTYRIAAVQQLQEYAKIIKVPCRVAADFRQLDQVLEEFADRDLVLMDTAGRSQRDELQMSELRDMMRGRNEIKNLLVLSSTTKDNDLSEITKRFSTVPLHGVVFTKLDESTNYGSIFNHSIRFKLPLTYLTTGQNVPEDIENASRERLIDLLLNISGE